MAAMASPKAFPVALAKDKAMSASDAFTAAKNNDADAETLRRIFQMATPSDRETIAKNYPGIEEELAGGRRRRKSRRGTKKTKKAGRRSKKSSRSRRR